MAQAAADIAAVLAEIGPILQGGRIQKVFQPAEKIFTLEIRASGRTVTLLLSADPETARLHLVIQRLANPASPPSFCQYLRAHVEGARVEQIEQVDNDRIVRVQLATVQGPKALVLELTGRSADLLLLKADEIVMAALNAGRSRVGQPYVPPPRRPGSIAGRQVLSESSQKRSTGNAEPADHPFPLSAAIEQEYGRQEETLTLQRLRAVRQNDLRRRIKKTRRHLEALEVDLQKAARYKDYARYGDLLKANLGTIAKGQSEVSVVDYFDPAMPELLIPLDPGKSPHGNMEDYFKKHRKFLTAQREILPRLEALQQDLEKSQAELSAVQQVGWQPPAMAMRTGGSRSGVAPRGAAIKRTAANVERSSKSRPGPFRRFISSDGVPIYVGRNARENDELTFGLAHSDDLWLHARGVPGSHVVVRLERGAEAPFETLRDAATLALVYSDLKKSGKGEVIYTRRKYVRKTKRQPQGTVSVTQEKALFLQLDKTRLQRLKGARREE
jgi:predicted ribosome quality control (RQC) complex YloA/Tae2 family protein